MNKWNLTFGFVVALHKKCSMILLKEIWLCFAIVCLTWLCHCVAYEVFDNLTQWNLCLLIVIYYGNDINEKLGLNYIELVLLNSNSNNILISQLEVHFYDLWVLPLRFLAWLFVNLLVSLINSEACAHFDEAMIIMNLWVTFTLFNVVWI